MYHNYSWRFSLCVFYRIYDEGQKVIHISQLNFWLILWFQMSFHFFFEKCSLGFLSRHIRIRAVLKFVIWLSIVKSRLNDYTHWNIKIWNNKKHSCKCRSMRNKLKIAWRPNGVWFWEWNASRNVLAIINFRIGVGQTLYRQKAFSQKKKIWK